MPNPYLFSLLLQTLARWVAILFDDGPDDSRDEYVIPKD